MESETKSRYLDCEKCGEKIAERYLEGVGGWSGRWVKEPCPVCAEKKKKAEYERFKTLWLDKMDHRLKDVGVPKRFIPAKLDIKLDMSKSYYFCGPPGTGKTHIATGMLRAIMEAIEPVWNDRRDEYWPPEFRGVFITAPELLLEIRDTFKSSGEASEKSIVKKYSEIDVLVLDDLGVEKTSEWSMQMLYMILNGRYVEMKQTIITSNLTLEQLAQKLDDRLASRLAELCTVKNFKGKDKRLQM